MFGVGINTLPHGTSYILHSHGLLHGHDIPHEVPPPPVPLELHHRVLHMMRVVGCILWEVVEYGQVGRFGRRKGPGKLGTRTARAVWVMMDAVHICVEDEMHRVWA